MEKELQQKEMENTGKQPYEPPKAIFVPLKVEERLMACPKIDLIQPPFCGTGESS